MVRVQKRSRSPEDSAFAWYQPIAAALPPVMSPEQTIAAARAVEVGLLAEEQLDTLDRAGCHFYAHTRLATR